MTFRASEITSKSYLELSRLEPHHHPSNSELAQALSRIPSMPPGIVSCIQRHGATSSPKETMSFADFIQSNQFGDSRQLLEAAGLSHPSRHPVFRSIYLASANAAPERYWMHVGKLLDRYGFADDEDHPAATSILRWPLRLLVSAGDGQPTHTPNKQRTAKKGLLDTTNELIKRYRQHNGRDVEGNMKAFQERTSLHDIVSGLNEALTQAGEGVRVVVKDAEGREWRASDVRIDLPGSKRVGMSDMLFWMRSVFQSWEIRPMGSSEKMQRHKVFSQQLSNFFELNNAPNHQLAHDTSRDVLELLYPNERILTDTRIRGTPQN